MRDGLTGLKISYMMASGYTLYMIMLINIIEQYKRLFKVNNHFHFHPSGVLFVELHESPWLSVQVLEQLIEFPVEVEVNSLKCRML